MVRKIVICFVVLLTVGLISFFVAKWYLTLPKSVELDGIIKIVSRPQIVENSGEKKDQFKFSDGPVLYSDKGTFPLFGDTQNMNLYDGELVRVSGSITNNQFQRIIVSHYEPLDKGITIKYGRLRLSPDSRYKCELILPDNSAIKLYGNLDGIDALIDKLVIMRGQVDSTNTSEPQKDVMTVKSFNLYKPE